MYMYLAREAKRTSAEIETVKKGGNNGRNLHASLVSSTSHNSDTAVSSERGATSKGASREEASSARVYTWCPVRSTVVHLLRVLA